MTQALFDKTNKQNETIAFYDDGTLYASTRSYEINSFGEIELSKEETRNLYEKMRKFYKEQHEKPSKNTDATVSVHTYYSRGLERWVGEVEYKTETGHGIARYTADTEAEARITAYAAIGYLLVKPRFRDEEG